MQQSLLDQRCPKNWFRPCNVSQTRPIIAKIFLFACFLLRLELNSQHHEVNEQVNEFEQVLTNLEDDFKSNKEFQELQSNSKNIRDMMVQANESNVELHRHMTTIIDHLKILNAPLDQLEKNLPIITELDGKHEKQDQSSTNFYLDENNQPKLARLALLNEKVETMKKQREMLLNDFRKKIHDDDITKLVLMQRQDNHKVIDHNHLLGLFNP